MSPPRRAIALGALLCVACESPLASDDFALIDDLPPDTTAVSFPFPPAASRAIYQLMVRHRQTLPVEGTTGAPLLAHEIRCFAEAIRPNRGRNGEMPLDSRNRLICDATSTRKPIRLALVLDQQPLNLAYGNNLTKHTFSISTHIDVDYRGNIHSTQEEVQAFNNHLARKLFYAIAEDAAIERTPKTIYSADNLAFGTPGVSAIADYMLAVEILPRPEERKDPNGPPVAGERAVLTCLLSGFFAQGRQVDRAAMCAFIDEHDR